MIWNYVKIAWRNYIRDKSFSLINTIGLAIGLGAFLIVFLFVYKEWSYDRHHLDADRLYRITKVFERDDFRRESLSTANMLAPTLLEEIPGIENVLRINNTFGESIVAFNDKKFIESRFFIADESIFDFFSYKVIEGEKAKMLNAPYTVVITETTKQKYFGNEPALGKSLTIETWSAHDYEVTGVIEDIPDNTHFNFDILTSTETLRSVVPNPEQRFESWFYVGASTYLKLEKGFSANEIEANFDDFLSKHKGERATYESMSLQPVVDIHLHSNFDEEFQPNSDIRYLYIFGSVALLILIVSCINYVNLATAKSSDRAMEVGVRKTFGVQRNQLIGQFLFEGLITCLISIGLAFLLVELCLPFFNNLTGQNLSLYYSSPIFWVAVTGFYFLFSIISSIYPSLYLSRINPHRIFSNKASQKNKLHLRNGLIVFQFGISIFLIIGTFSIKAQLDFIQNKKLGIQANQIITINSDGIGSNYTSFKEELRKIPAINSISYSTRKLPLTSEIEMSLYPKGQSPDNNNLLSIGDDFLETMNITLVSGNLLDQYPSISELDYFPVLVNETAAIEFGWDSDPIGKTFDGFSPPATVVGVISDFHYESVKERIEPLVLGQLGRPVYTYININTSNIRALLSQIETVWETTGPGTPFTYHFMDAEYQNLYLAEDRLASIFRYFTILAIFISCLGLFGLASFSANRRTKEVGIRKVLGASIANIVGLLSRDFILLVFFGFALATPFSWYLINIWLTNFAYKIDISPWVFIGAGFVTLGIALSTVCFQAYRAALANPVESLRNE